jgi:hypothetical protein
MDQSSMAARATPSWPAKHNAQLARGTVHALQKKEKRKKKNPQDASLDGRVKGTTRRAFVCEWKEETAFEHDITFSLPPAY